MMQGHNRNPALRTKRELSSHAQRRLIKKGYDRVTHQQTVDVPLIYCSRRQIYSPFGVRVRVWKIRADAKCIEPVGKKLIFEPCLG